MLVVLLLVNIVSLADSTKNPLMPFSRWVALVHFVSSDVVVHVSNLLFFVSLTLSFSRTESFVRRLSLKCLFFFFRFEKSGTLVFFVSMKFCDVIAGAFGVSGCIPVQTVLRDVAFVVQFWGAIEHIRLLSMTSLFRSVVSFAVFPKMCLWRTR